jgi:hypothetical protein
MKESLYAEKAEDIAAQLPIEAQSLGVKLMKIFLGGDIVIQHALYHKGIIKSLPVKQDDPNYNGFIFCPNLDSYVDFLLIAQEKAIFEYDTFGQSHLVQFPQGMELYLQSKGYIEGAKITVTWTKTAPNDMLLCSAQCLYHMRTKTLYWKNKYHHDLFCRKILFFSGWKNLFSTLNFALQMEDHYLRIYTEKKINFLFGLYAKLLCEGWTLAPSDRYHLEAWFSYGTWRQYFNDSYRANIEKKALKAAKEKSLNKPMQNMQSLGTVEPIELMQALHLNQYNNHVNTPPNTQFFVEKNATLTDGALTKQKTEETIPKSNVFAMQQGMPILNHGNNDNNNDSNNDGDDDSNQDDKDSDFTIVISDNAPLHASLEIEEEEEEFIGVRKNKLDDEETLQKKYNEAQERFKKNQKIVDAVAEHLRTRDEKKKEKSVEVSSSSTRSRIVSTPAKRTKKTKHTQGDKKTEDSSHLFVESEDEDEEEIQNKSKKRVYKNTLWKTFRQLTNWAYEHPIMAFIGIFSFTAIIAKMLEIQPAVAPVAKNTCFDHFDILAGNADFEDANLLVILQNVDDPYAPICLKEFNTERLLLENQPLGKDVPCARECIGWDSISLDRALKGKSDILEKNTFAFLNNIYASNKHTLNKFQPTLKDLYSDLKKIKTALENKYHYSEASIQTNIDYKNLQAQDEYRTVIVKMKHIKYFITQKKTIQEIKTLFQQYQEIFAPKIEEYNPSTSEVHNRMNAMHQAMINFVVATKKVAIYANEKIFLPYYESFISPERKGKGLEPTPSYVVLKRKNE